MARPDPSTPGSKPPQPQRQPRHRRRCTSRLQHQRDLGRPPTLLTTLTGVCLGTTAGRKRVMSTDQPELDANTGRVDQTAAGGELQPAPDVAEEYAESIPIDPSPDQVEHYLELAGAPHALEDAGDQDTRDDETDDADL